MVARFVSLHRKEDLRMIFNFDPRPSAKLVNACVRQLSDHFVLWDIKELKWERGLLRGIVSIVIDDVRWNLLGFRYFCNMTFNFALVTVELPGPTKLFSWFLVIVPLVFGSTVTISLVLGCLRVLLGDLVGFWASLHNQRTANFSRLEILC